MVPKDDALSSLSRDLVLAICLTLQVLSGAGAHRWGNALPLEDKKDNSTEPQAIQIMYVTLCPFGKAECHLVPELANILVWELKETSSHLNTSTLTHARVHELDAYRPCPYAPDHHTCPPAGKETVAF